MELAQGGPGPVGGRDRCPIIVYRAVLDYPADRSCEARSGPLAASGGFGGSKRLEYVAAFLNGF